MSDIKTRDYVRSLIGVTEGWKLNRLAEAFEDKDSEILALSQGLSNERSATG